MRRPALAALLGLALGVALLGLAAPVFAQAGPFGVGNPELGTSAPQGTIFAWIIHQQSVFYLALKSGLRAMKADPHAGLWMVVLSFLYGVFHAAGPGHGKAVITSYVLANDETLKRGMILAFISALVQGVVAIALVGAAILVFNLTALQMTDATTALERASAAAIFALGLWLTWTKIVEPILRARRAALAVPAPASEADVVDCAIGGDPAAVAPACPCGVSHIPDPKLIKGPFDWKKALGAIAAVGIRPCTGALIVLVFAFAQRMPFAGMASVVAMALGTGTTVAALASLAVSARALALRIAGDEGPWPMRILRTAEVTGALLVLTAGTLLGGAAIWGGPIGG
nr:nickel/cobalt transporter [Hyphomicrobiales bacterium]